MERIDELLPGIEEYLSETLASEALSPFAEQKRLFFLERLDIVKLPPTVPPREGRFVSQELLKDTEEKSGIPSSQSITRQQPPTPDFAATQREISRSLKGTGSPVTEDKEEKHDGDDDSMEEVKVYDDIDMPDNSDKDGDDHGEVKGGVDNPYEGEDMDDLNISLNSSNNNNNNTIILHNNDDDDDDDDNGENDYEIPVAMQQLSDDGGSHPSLAFAESTEELQDDVLEMPSAATMGPPPVPPPVPPPLPPRRDIRFSDSGSRSSINGLTEEAPPDLPYRPQLPRRGEMCGRSERSDKSDPDISGDGDSTSYESFDDDDEDPNNRSGKSIKTDNPDTADRNASIKLPAKASKKKTLKMSKKMPKSKSLSQWEISAPFRKLDNVDVSGELFHKGKLTWNRRLVAITNGCLAMYKPDKVDGRPMAVIPLMGYEAVVTEKKEKGRGFEIKMTHPQDDTHLFSVDVKEWAYAWKEHINNNSRGHRPSSSGRNVRLSRALSSELGMISGTGTLTQTSRNTGSHGSKTDLNGSNSNLSTGSEGGRPEDAVVRPRLRSGNKVMRMGSFAFRATQFFENISKKTSVKRKQSSQSYSGENTNTNIDANKTTTSTNGPKPRGVSVDSSDSQDFAYNGANSNTGSHSNILEESSISSNSASNPSHSPFNSPTSDLNMPVFSDNNSIPSNSPTTINSPGFADDVVAGKRPASRTSDKSVTVNDQSYLQDVSHKGYLFIFSTFNRRRWGKRWCLVRGNYFECYRSEDQPASQCELSILLKACVMRRAVMETGSELALMLVEVDTNKERITVEPVTEREMPAWVQVLMAETSTQSLPEGLEEHMRTLEARRGSDAPSVLSLSVLKQWDMDITLQSLGSSSKETTSPEDSPSTTAWQLSSGETTHGDNEENNNNNPHSTSEARTPTPEDNDIPAEASSPFFKEVAAPLVQVDNLVPQIKKKHTTDSGFYSVKGNNSDSDGEHVELVHNTINDIQKETAEDKDRDYTLNLGLSVVESHNFNHHHHHHNHSSKNTDTDRNSNDRCDDYESVSKTVAPTHENIFSSTLPPFINVPNVNTSDKLCSSSNAVTNIGARKLSLPSTGPLPPLPPSSSTPPVSQPLPKSSPSSPTHHSAIIPSSSFQNSTQTKSSNNNSTPPNPVTTAQRSSSSTNSSDPSSAEPSSPNDEYSFVVKRSLRRKTQKTSGDTNDISHVSCEDRNSTQIQESVANINDESSNSEMFFESPNIEVEEEDEETDDELPPPLPPPMPPTESIYEEVVVKKNETITEANSSPPTSNHFVENDDQPFKSPCNEDHFDHLIQSLEEDKNIIQNRPSISSISDLIEDHIEDAPTKTVNGTKSQCETETPRHQSQTFNEDVESVNVNSTHENNGRTLILSSVSSDSSACDSNVSHTSFVTTPSSSKLSVTLVSSEKTPRKGAITPISIKSISSSLPGDSPGHSSPAIPLTSSSSSSTTPSCQSPELPVVEVHRPGMTEDELREAIEGLKQKKSHLKRKRLAVHDKRQRVSSDEERLACEKEFASLEREVEATDSDIGFLQNQLDALCGHSLEAIKINSSKKKSGSGKKKKSKKKPH